MYDDMIAYFEKLYPDRAVLDDIDEFTRIKEAGKIELLKEIQFFVKEEYGKNKGVQNG